MSYRWVARIVHWSLLVLTLLVVVTGLGITEYQVVTASTFGLLGKALAFKLHLWLWIPFVVIFVAHVVLTVRPFRRHRTKSLSPDTW
jgi:thiosulfate reductase cytochrome b subunit